MSRSPASGTHPRSLTVATLALGVATTGWLLGGVAAPAVAGGGSEHSQPGHGQPSHGQPSHGQPSHGQPSHGQPQRSPRERPPAAEQHGHAGRHRQPALHSQPAPRSKPAPHSEATPHRNRPESRRSAPPEPSRRASSGRGHDAGSGRSSAHRRSHAAPPASHAHGPSTSDRPGNNGTVKIDRIPFDSHPDNQPHVTCDAFQVDFYNYGAGDFYADLHFTMQAPTRYAGPDVTSGDLQPFIGQDAPGGGTDVDAQQTYTLAFSGEPHPKQGYHVKLTVHADRSHGSDVKHKVFWIEPCRQAPSGGGQQGPGGGQGQVPGGGQEQVPGGGQEQGPGGGQGQVPGGGQEQVPGGGQKQGPGGGQGEVPGGGQQTPPGGAVEVPGGSGAAAGAARPSTTTVASGPPGSALSSNLLATVGARGTTGTQRAGSVAAAQPTRAGGGTAQVPTVVEAGLAGRDVADDLGGVLATSLLGLCALIAAGAAALAYRRRGA